MRKLMTVLLAALFVVSVSSVALAQGFDGTLRGDVKDPKGLAIDGAKITIKNEGTGQERHTTTSSGGFNAPNLLAGIYTVTVEIEGFKKYVRKGVEVRQNQVTEVAIALELGAVTTVVEVNASGELVQTTTSDLASSWDNRAVTELVLPSVGINPDPQNLAILLPGTTTQSGGVAGYGGSIGGNRPRNNNFVLDGVDNNNMGVTGPNQPVIPDAIGELTIITNQFSAEYGHSTAGQFIQTTKSGTNSIHGNAFWYNNNRAYNSVDNFTKGGILNGSLDGKPRFDLNRLGGSAGGPIIKDHWFIFGAYQYLTLGASSLPGSAVSVPTAAGITALQTLATTPGSGVSPLMLGIITSLLPTAPSQNSTVAVTNTSTGATTQIPVGIISPAAPNFQVEHDIAISSDVQTSKHRFSTRVLYDQFHAPLTGETTVPSFTGSQFAHYRSVTFSDVYAITPHVVNEFRAGYRRQVNGFAPPPLTPPGPLDVFPNFLIIPLNLNIGPSGETPQSATLDTYQWTDNLSISKGAHTLKMGVQVMLWIAPTVFLSRSRAEYDYVSLDSFVHDSFGGSILGPTLALRGIGSGAFAGNQKGFYTFFQDDWKVSSRLTLNLGLRYEYTNNPRILAEQAANSISNLTNPTRPGLLPLIFGVPGTDTNNWGPRIGFAYDVFGDHKTSIRGGFAVAYDILFSNLYTAGAVPPQLSSELGIPGACAFPAPFTPKYCPLLANGALSGPFIANGGLPQSAPGGGSQALDQADARSLTSSIIPDSVSPKSLSWTLGVQHQFGKDWAVETRYVGNRGISLLTQVRLNSRPIPPTSGCTGSACFLPTFFTNAAATTYAGTATATSPNLSAFNAFGAQRLYQPDGFTGNMTDFTSQGQSIYHGGSVNVTRRISSLGRWGHGAFLNASYTYSKEIDNATNDFFTSNINPRRAQDGYNLADERGVGAIDHTHKVALAVIYELPWYNGSSGFMKGFTNGWQISATFIAETGQPVTLLSFTDSNHNGDAAGDRAIVNPNFTAPNTGTDVNVLCRNGTIAASACAGGTVDIIGYVAKDPTAQYVTAQPGALANVGRDTVRIPGINNWNFGFLKKTYITESKYLEFRASFVNAFNHAQPTLGGGTIEELNANSSSPGSPIVQVTDQSNQFLNARNVLSTGNGNSPFQRVISFGLRVVF
jgi:hypothetical protein